MIKHDKDFYIEQYTELFTSIEKAINTNDYKLNNKLYTQTAKLFKKIEHDKVLAEEVFACLIDNKNPHVSIGIAVHAISIGLLLSQSKKVLEKFAKSPPGIILVSASNTLEAWKDQGYLLVYPNQEQMKTYT